MKQTSSNDKSLENQKNELIKNNSFYDITGNMTIWKVHETYIGTGNDLLSEKNIDIEKVKKNKQFI